MLAGKLVTYVYYFWMNHWFTVYFAVLILLPQSQVIASTTRGQNKNVDWFKQRIGAVTSSLLYNIHKCLKPNSKITAGYKGVNIWSYIWFFLGVSNAHVIMSLSFFQLSYYWGWCKLAKPDNYICCLSRFMTVIASQVNTQGKHVMILLFHTLVDFY